ncbi:hypothetical protein [Alkalimarinus sediminis]|uniref:Uncharacterized protein n=1 Tax=Alkalimarinus sediminis TaxID=1632866 RepID=A0A9E8HIG0_9ALTE|nr:hypothetical protein [Alkalimarinus sediminis]UZW74792.1 hypothetical protein NNL22_17500 [Alkalimarinus sediminis]
MPELTALWGFPINEQLHLDTHETVEKIQLDCGKGTKELNQQAARIVVKLTLHGLEHYYQRPTEIVPLPPTMKKAADTGIKAVMGAIHLVIKQFFKKRNDEELKQLSLYIQQMLWTHPDKNEPHLVFAVHEALHSKAIELIEQVRTEKNTDAYIDDVIDALCELVELAVANYYHYPTDKVEMGNMSKKTADLGINQAEKGIRKLIDKLLREVSHRQLVELSYHLESMIHQKPA